MNESNSHLLTMLLHEREKAMTHCQKLNNFSGFVQVRACCPVNPWISIDLESRIYVNAVLDQLLLLA